MTDKGGEPDEDMIQEKAAPDSAGSKVRTLYRNARFRVKHPIAQAISWTKSLAPHASYSYWIKHCEKPGYSPERIAQEIGGFRYAPKVSIVMPVYETPLDLLDLAIQSVLGQHYANWELCICNDGSPDPAVELAWKAGRNKTLGSKSHTPPRMKG